MEVNGINTRFVIKNLIEFLVIIVKSTKRFDKLRVRVHSIKLHG